MDDSRSRRQNDDKYGPLRVQSFGTTLALIVVQLPAAIVVLADFTSVALFATVHDAPWRHQVPDDAGGRGRCRIGRPMPVVQVRRRPGRQGTHSRAARDFRERLPGARGPRRFRSSRTRGCGTGRMGATGSTKGRPDRLRMHGTSDRKWFPWMILEDLTRSFWVSILPNRSNKFGEYPVRVLSRICDVRCRTVMTSSGGIGRAVAR